MRFVASFPIISVLCIFCNSIIRETAAANFPSLCSFKKSHITCSCYHKVNSVLPVYIADCTRMSFTDFPRDLQLEKVQELDLSHNAISHLDSNTNNFESFTLQHLKLSFSQITIIRPGFFKNIPNLLELDLSHNRIVNFVNSNIFKGLTNLEVLNLSYNELSTLPEEIFSNLQHLKKLDLSYNYLGALFMATSCIFNSNLGISSNLTWLKMEGLEISSLHFEAFDGEHNLKYLSLADNPLNDIPSIPYSVEHLDLSGILITNLSARNFNYHSLKILKLNRLQKLEKIEHYAFYNLEALEELHLNDCRRLKEFNELTFGVIVEGIDWHLKKIYFARSGLKSLNSTFLNLFVKLEHLDLKGNPWNCDCGIRWLQQLNGTLLINNDLRCLSPFNLLNKKIMELTDEDLPKCNNGDNNYQKILISILGSLISILAILIIYLVYLGPFYHKNIYRGIGPESPYNSNTIGIIPTRAENLS